MSGNCVHRSFAGGHVDSVGGGITGEVVVAGSVVQTVLPILCGQQVLGPVSVNQCQ